MKKATVVLTTISLPLDFLMLILAGIAAYFLRFHSFFTKIKPVIFSLSFDKYFPLMLTVAIGWLALFALAGLYSVKPNRKLPNELSRVLYACSTGLAAITIYIFFRNELFNSRFIVLAGWILAIIFVSAERIILRIVKRLLYRAGLGTRRIVIIGEGRVSDMLFQTLMGERSLGYYVIARFKQFDPQTERTLAELSNKKMLDQVLLANPRAREQETLAIVDFCENHHVDFKYSADLFSTLARNISIEPVGGVPIVEIQKTRLQAWGRVLKRLLDIIGALVLVILSSPFMIAAALAILVESGRPIIYKNERVGEGGKRFFTLKFRSMHKKYCTGAQFGNDAKALEFEKDLIQKQSIKEGPVYKIQNDPRVTKVGRFIRKTSLDELPQLFNVLKGEMSLVGPRPHQPREVEQYEKHHRRVLNIKPGITGLAQISGRSDLEFEEEVRLDTFYIENWSAVMDFIILLKTPFVLAKPRKAL